jgi:isopenicillin N synthase-like dioxygenase
VSLVPTIDISAARPDEVIAGDIDDACRRIGFMQVVGHGIADQVRDAMLAATQAFFELPLERKLLVVPPAPEVNRGYAARGAEGLAYSVGVTRPPDLFEAFNIGPDTPDVSDPAVAAERHRLFAENLWPDDVPALRPALVAWFDEARRVADRLLQLFAPALGMPDGYFAPFTNHSTDTLRVNHYGMAPGDPDPLDGQLGMGEHTDYGIVTVLYADPVPGLQIIGPDGAWHDVVPEPGALLVNLGDLTATWTNDRWRSTVHRVLPPARSPDRAVTRRSVAFFHDGNHDAVVECLPTCTAAGDPPKYAPITAGEHLMAKLLGPRTLTASDATQTTGTRLP